MADKRNNFIRFLGYVRPYAWQVAVGAMGGVVKFTLPLAIPLMTRYLLDDVLTNDAMAAAEKLRQIAWCVGGMMLAFVVFYAPWVFVRHYFTSRAGHRSVFDLRCQLYYRILRMSSSFFGRNKSGEIVSRLISDIQLTQNLVGSALTNVWMDAAAILVVLTLLLTTDVGITFVSLATFPLYIYSFNKLRGKIRSSSYQMQQEVANLSGNVSEKVSGSVVIHAFTQERREEKRFHRDSERIFSRAMRTQFLQSLNMMIAGTITNLAPLIVLMYGGYQVVQQRLTLGDLVAVTMWLGPLYMPLQRFSELNVVFANSMAALDRIFEIMDEEPEIKDKPDAVDLAEARGEVAFDNVSFHYETGKPVLQDVSFAVRPGMRVAFVGHSGSGKSTCVSLIPRLYDVTAGGVRIDGRDVRDLRLASLRKHIGIVLQDPILFSGSIRDNILYGRPGASEKDLAEACRAANALDFIEALPDGLETEVGERGGFLSGGQKQRITIARAFLKDPKILILDEPTSALDAASEQLIQEALDRLMAGKTTFIIAHRLSTVVHTDRIMVLEDGRLLESGPHAELLEKSPLYRGLYEQQFAAAGP